MLTPWGENLNTAAPLPEYPRPQMARDSFLNLNGPWSYAITKTPQRPQKADGTILVPFSPESPLSGVGHTLQPDEYLWYIRTFRLPEGFNVGCVLLHFGAVDQTATVWCNGVEVASHTGGYLPFTAELTNALREENTLIVCVQDKTGTVPIARGKQSLKPGGIWYPPQSGIWQTVWLESVPRNYIKGLRITPNPDEKRVEIRVEGKGHCTLSLGKRRFGFPAGMTVHVPVENPVLWTPEHHALYPFRVKLGADEVYSYFAMRTVSVERDENGVMRLFLNGKPYFHNGVLDQGYWSDGLYTPPSDEAMLYDIETAKKMGFNMLRKHMKVEPDRWYYHCDRLGMLVWQDMPCGGGKYRFPVITAPLFTGISLDDSRYPLFSRSSAAGRAQFMEELGDMVRALYNHPCIVLWVPFNEGWGQFDSRTAVELIESIDRTRPIDPASGWHDQGFGVFRSLHVYFRRYKFKKDKLDRAVILTEFGGYTHRVPNHAARGRAFGYKSCRTREKLTDALRRLYWSEIQPAMQQGLAAAVYTQLTDVETELNGLITYDRRVEKLTPETVRAIITPEEEKPDAE